MDVKEEGQTRSVVRTTVSVGNNSGQGRPAGRPELCDPRRDTVLDVSALWSLSDAIRPPKVFVIIGLRKPLIGDIMEATVDPPLFNSRRSTRHLTPAVMTAAFGVS